MPWTTEDVEKHKAGLTNKQKKQWVRIANAVRTRLLAKGKKEKEADAEAIKQANGVVNANASTGTYTLCTHKQSDYEPKLVVHQEKAHIVIPVVMMIEGVHSGSMGPLLHEIGELGKYPASWDGRPVVIYHPEIDGVPVSANSPDIIDTRTVGRVYNTNVDGTKLKAEVWLDEDKLNAISEETLVAINSSKEMEVSLGMFTDIEEKEGTYGEETYVGIAHNHRPDHLAILPDQIGACSCADGCGLGVNERKGCEEGIFEGKTLFKTLNVNLEEFYKVEKIEVNKKQGYYEKISAIGDALRKLDTKDTYHYVEELYDDSVIYSVSGDGNRAMLKQSYKFESGKIEFVGEPITVVRKVEYVTVNNVEPKKEDKMSKNECPACQAKIEALIANKDSGFAEADREMLNALTETQLDKLTPKVVEKTVEVEKTIEVNKLAPEDQAALAFGKKQMKERRERWVKGIQANTKNVWTDEKLGKMDDDTLESIYMSVYKEAEQPTNYGLLGGATGINDNASGDEIEPLLPAGTELSESK
jgi:hypothetical protein